MGSDMKPDTATRYCDPYRDGKLYLIATEDELGNITSVIMEQTTDVADNYVTRCGLEFVSGLINELIECGKFEAVLHIAKQAGESGRTLPGIIQRRLRGE